MLTTTALRSGGAHLRQKRRPAYFLRHALRFLLDRCARDEAQRNARARLVVSHCLYGVDVQPDAVRIARRSLRLACGADDDPDVRAALRAHLGVGDSLTGRLSVAGDDDGHDAAGFDWDAVLGDGFDAVLGNPPWGRLVGTDAARRIRALVRRSPAYPVGRRCRGLNLYHLFVERAIWLLRPGGRFGLVLPDTAVADPSAHGVRRLLLAAAPSASPLSLERLWQFRARTLWRTVSSGVVVVVGERRAPDPHHRYRIATECPAVRWAEAHTTSVAVADAVATDTLLPVVERPLGARRFGTAPRVRQLAGVRPPPSRAGAADPPTGVLLHKGSAFHVAYVFDDFEWSFKQTGPRRVDAAWVGRSAVARTIDANRGRMVARGKVIARYTETPVRAARLPTEEEVYVDDQVYLHWIDGGGEWTAYLLLGSADRPRRRRSSATPTVEQRRRQPFCATDRRSVDGPRHGSRAGPRPLPRRPAAGPQPAL